MTLIGKLFGRAERAFASGDGELALRLFEELARTGDADGQCMKVYSCQIRYDIIPIKNFSFPR
jgi:hypothetical protein